MTEEFKPQYLISSEVKKEPPVKKGHVCGVCQKWFKKSSDLRRHNSVHSKEKPIACDHCNSKFANKDRLYHHLKYLSLERTHHCEFCEKSFKTVGCLKLHVRVHSEEKPFKCEMCNKCFRRKNALENHYGSRTYLAHHKQFDEFKQFEYCLEKYKPIIGEKYSVDVDSNKHVCTLCNKKFKNAQNLRYHAVCHRDDKPYECVACGKKFKSKKSLSNHNRFMHSSIKEVYFCEACKKPFSSKNSLHGHKMVHEQDKPFKCEICPLAFKRKYRLVRHISLHSGEKKFTCEICGKMFKFLNSLRIHIRDHTGEKPYVCEICNKVFKAANSLGKHLKVHKKNGTILNVEENICKIGLILSENENTDSNKGLALPQETSCQPKSTALSPPHKPLNKVNSQKFFASKDIKFIKIQDKAELNLLKITSLIQRYRCLSNVYSK